MLKLHAPRLVGCLVGALFALGAVRGLHAEFRIALGSGSAEENLEVVNIPVFLTNDEPVQGLIVVVEWDPCYGDGVDLVVPTTAGSPLAGADILETRLETNYAILTALVDLDGEGPAAIAPGVDQRIATVQIRCICGGPEYRSAVVLPHKSYRSLVDGGRLLDNMVVVDGMAMFMADGLELQNGELVCNADEGPGPDNPMVSCGQLDPSGDLLPVEGAPGETVAVCFFYKAPEPASAYLGIQGFSLSVEYDCQLTCDEGSITTTGSILEEIGAEYLAMHCDNDPGDSDGCEMIVGMLIDYDPPFDGRTLPGADEYTLLFCADFTISTTAVEDDLLAVEFVDGLNGRGSVPMYNLVSINFYDEPWETATCAVRVVGGGGDRDFIRGDCNFNTRLNVADVAAVIGFLFLGRGDGFDPPCMDACDTDDTGLIDISDATYLLNYLFIVGSPAPPPPGPRVPGPDPTDDELGC